MHCRVMGSFAYRIFFVSFFVIVVMVCLNVLLAFIIDMFVTQTGELRKKHHVRRNHVKDEDEEHLKPKLKFSLVPMNTQDQHS